MPTPDAAARVPAGNVTPASIFASAAPRETLVSRIETNAARTLLAAISGVGRCVRICGPTKSGKTVLIREALLDREPIYLSGRRVEDIRSFYEEIAARLDPSFSSNVVEAFIFARAAEAKRPIVIDDYHRIPLRTRKAIVNRIQSFLDEDISVILVSWTDIDGDLIANDPGLDGRAPPPINISFWRNADLEKIGQQGFAALNVRPSAFTLSLITRHSYKNPYLMHEHCRAFAEACGITARPDTEMTFAVTAEKAISVFSSLCASTKRNFLPLIESRGSDRFSLRSGKSTTAFGLIALGVRRMQPIHAIGMQKLAENVRELVAEPARINRHTTKEHVDEFMEVLAKSPHMHTAIELSGDKLHIHPFFKRYLLWDFAPSKGLGYPDMTNYQDEVCCATCKTPPLATLKMPPCRRWEVSNGARRSSSVAAADQSSAETTDARARRGRSDARPQARRLGRQEDRPGVRRLRQDGAAASESRRLERLQGSRARFGADWP